MILLLLLALAADEAAWQSDVDFLARELAARHVDAFAHLPKEEFLARAEALKARIPELDDLHRRGGLATLAAALGDSHTTVVVPEFQENPFPLGLYWWMDGMRVILAPKEARAAVGGKVVRIGRLGFDEAIAALRTVECMDNESLVRSRAPNRLVIPALLRFLGAIDDPASLPLTVADDAGREWTVTVAAGPVRPDAARIRPGASVLTFRERGKLHHHAYLEAEGLLYVQYNACASTPEQDLDAFTGKLAALCATGAVRSIVFDLQYNGGGDSRLGDRMFRTLAEHPPMRDRRNVFCVIGRGTFSSAILNAKSLEKEYGAVLVGEPTGGSPNHFGELKTFELPHSKLTVFHSTKRFERGPPGATTIEPHHRAEPTFADWRLGRDPILETIRSLVR